MLRWPIPLLFAICAWAAPPDTAGIDFTQHQGARLDLGATLTDQDNRAATLGDLMAGKPAILLLGYFHCPTLCGTVRENAFGALAQTGLATPADYQVLDISIDPQEIPADAAVARRADLAAFPIPGAAQGWHYLTGPAAQAIAQTVGFHARWDKDLRQYLHPTGMVVLTPAGRVSSYIMGAGYPPAELRADLLNARDGAVAEPVAAPTLLLCLHFDASTGKYSLDVRRALQLGGAAIVMMIGALVAVLHRRSRRKLDPA